MLPTVICFQLVSPALLHTNLFRVQFSRDRGSVVEVKWSSMITQTCIHMNHHFSRKEKKKQKEEMFSLEKFTMQRGAFNQKTIYTGVESTLKATSDLKMHLF